MRLSPDAALPCLSHQRLTQRMRQHLCKMMMTMPAHPLPSQVAQHSYMSWILPGQQVRECCKPDLLKSLSFDAAVLWRQVLLPSTITSFSTATTLCSAISVAGVSLAGELSIPAESPLLQAEASAATYSSSRLSSQSLSPVPQTPPDASTLLEAALSPNMAVDTMAFYGALHQLHAESSLTAGRVTIMSALTTAAQASLVVPRVSMLGRVQLLCSDFVNVLSMSQLVP